MELIDTIETAVTGTLSIFESKAVSEPEVIPAFDTLWLKIPRSIGSQLLTENTSRFPSSIHKMNVSTKLEANCGPLHFPRSKIHSREFFFLMYYLTKKVHTTNIPEEEKALGTVGEVD